MRIQFCKDRLNQFRAKRQKDNKQNFVELIPKPRLYHKRYQKTTKKERKMQVQRTSEKNNKFRRFRTQQI